VTVDGFEELQAYAQAGGHDTACLYDSDGTDKFKSEPAEDYAKMYGGRMYSRSRLNMQFASRRPCRGGTALGSVLKTRFVAADVDAQCGRHIVCKFSRGADSREDRVGGVVPGEGGKEDRCAGPWSFGPHTGRVFCGRNRRPKERVRMEIGAEPAQ
jgi:hypothetical protein